MTIEILLETTPDWDYSGGVYHVNKMTGKLYAYQKSQDSDIKVFSKPLMFSKSWRKFDKLGSYSL